MTQQLGKIDKVDLREIWPHEAHDFTKWLAKEENLSMLGDACGMELEPVETESPVGSFSADILAAESGGRRVIVENQLEDTNHDHLGKIITYAAGKRAQAVIWVVRHARDEHRSAIEWLNQHTDDGASFFLVEVEVWRIGGSLPAPRFNVVESPNDWTRAEKAKEGLSKTGQLQLAYWQRYVEAAKSSDAFVSRGLRPQSPQAQHWNTVRIGSSRYHLDANVLVSRSQIGVVVYFSDDKEDGGRAIENLGLLEERLGVKGAPFEGTKDCGIRFYRDGCGVRGHEEEWDGFIAWQIEKMAALHDAIKEIGL